MSDHPVMISYAEALDRIRRAATLRLPIETVPLVLSLGRTLAEDVISDCSVPAADNSAMDGYAVRAADVSGATAEHPAELEIIDQAPAGAPSDRTVAEGTAVSIMTGGVIPDGADAVVPVEWTTRENGLVRIDRSVSPGNAIRRIGEDVADGTRVIERGKRIGSGDIGLLATVGIANVPVRVKPKIGILATGSEVVQAHRTPERGQIRNSSTPSLFAACVEAGAEPIDLGIVSDSREELQEALEAALQYDILLTTGGVSAGEYDLVQHVLPELGVDILFHKTRIKPGKPMIFGQFGQGGNNSLVFGLPGNPVSSLMTFRQYVTPAIRQIMNSTERPVLLPATLEHDVRKKDDKYHFLRGIHSLHADDCVSVKTTGTQSSGAISSMSRATCVVHLPENLESPSKGSTVTIELL